ncbi:MAG: exonuclease domain-containing protein [Bacteroidales bacterium]|nr:exonuclease domain-containing protein [Bacteroidales bacterium]
MELNLNNPIAFFDLETTGINIVSDRIVEISILRISPKGEEEVLTERINPGIPIPQESSKIHGITDQDVKNAPSFKEVAKKLAKFIEGCDLGGYNCNKFDVPLLAEEFLRVGVEVNFKKRKVVDVQVIFHKMEQRTLSAAYKFYCSKDLTDAHSAQADTIATYEVLKAQLGHYDNLENDMQYLSQFSAHTKNVDFAGRVIYNDKGVEVFNFGKFKGKSVEQVLKDEPGYYGWIINGDFPLYTKNVVTEIKMRGFGK